MHLTDVFQRLSRDVGDRRGRVSRMPAVWLWVVYICGQGQVVLCFFGDGASKQGVFALDPEIASLWKLPIVFVMENNGYNVPHAYRAGGRQPRQRR